MVVVQNRAKLLPAARYSCAVFLLALCFLGLLIYLVCFLIFADSTGLSDNDYALSLRLTTRYTLKEMQEFAARNRLNLDYKPALYTRNSVSFNRLLLRTNNTSNNFEINGRDVLVFLHIQKTAGTSFEKFLVYNLNITRPCLCNQTIKRCKCYRTRSNKEFWLFSRYSTGWQCGLHADWTELSNCVERAMDDMEKEHRIRRYFYTTFLRHPVERFISEYRHVERGADWRRSRHVCNFRAPTPSELPMCFDPEIGWANVTLDEFLACPFNLAFNRQTRMLADLSLVHCYDVNAMPTTDRERIMLASAKTNLRNMAFFGLKEQMNNSQEMFEELFDLKFTKSLAKWNKSKSNDTVISRHQNRMILQLNALDMELYNYALKLFAKRLKQIRQRRAAASQF